MYTDENLAKLVLLADPLWMRLQDAFPAASSATFKACCSWAIRMATSRLKVI